LTPHPAEPIFDSDLLFSVSIFPKKKGPHRMASVKKKRKAKINRHKRKKRRRLNRHKKK